MEGDFFIAIHFVSIHQCQDHYQQEYSQFLLQQQLKDHSQLGQHDHQQLQRIQIGLRQYQHILHDLQIQFLLPPPLKGQKSTIQFPVVDRVVKKMEVQWVI